MDIKNDSVNHPAHYTAGKVECIDALEAATADLTGIEAVCTANAIKYLWRWKLKDGEQDLQKAIWYINRLCERLEQRKAAEAVDPIRTGTITQSCAECGRGTLDGGPLCPACLEDD